MNKEGLASRREAFRALHLGGCFVIPNPWDIGCAKDLRHLGFKVSGHNQRGRSTHCPRRNRSTC